MVKEPTFKFFNLPEPNKMNWHSFQFRSKFRWRQVQAWLLSASIDCLHGVTESGVRGQAITARGKGAGAGAGARAGTGAGAGEATGVGTGVGGGSGIGDHNFFS